MGINDGQQKALGWQMKHKSGEWIIVHPTDCFTMLPVYECSICKNLCSGYDPDPICIYCGSENKVNNKTYIEKAIWGTKE